MPLDSAQIRHRNFMRLFNDFIHKHPEAPQRGMLKLFAERLNMSDRYLSHIKCNRKNIGANIARAIEERLQLPHGWMDREQDLSIQPVNEQERLFIATALSLFRVQPDAARDVLLRSFQQQLRKAA